MNVWKNVAAKTLGEGAARVFNFLLSLMGARMLGPSSWGLYWSAFSLAHLGAVATDLGGHLTLARNVAQHRSSAPQHFVTALRFKLLLVTAMGALWALTAAVTDLGLPGALLYPMVVAILCMSFVEWLGHYLRGFGLVVDESLVMAADCLLAFGCGAVALIAGAGPAGLAWSQLAAHTTALGLALLWTRRRVPLGRISAAGTRLAGFFRRAAPTGIAIFVSMTSWRLGMLTLQGAYGNALGAAIGFYAVSQRLLEAAKFLPMAVAGALFPAFAQNRAQARPFLALALLLPMSVAFSLALTLPACSSLTLHFLFGENFGAAQPVLSRMAWAFPLMTINAVLTHWLIARGKERLNAGLSFLHLAAHAAGLWYLIPRFGAEGASSALIGAEAMLSVGTLLAVLRLHE